MKLEKTFHDEIEQFSKLGREIKVIPWTAGESSRSKIIPKNYPEIEIWNSRPYQETTYSNFKLRICSFLE